jgi:hypothetical protein
VQIEGVEMLALISGLRCVGSINPIGVVAGVWRQSNSTYWAKLSRFYLQTETESNSRNAVYF